MTKQSLGIVALLVTLSSGASAQTFQLESRDPLSEAPPTTRHPLVLPQDQRPASDKILASLWSKSARVNPEETIRVVVTLHEPAAQRTTTGDAETERTDRIAVLEHDFADRAQEVGFTAARGLSHFPIVFGEITPQSLEELAALPHVRAVHEERTYRLDRTDGGAMMRSPQLRNQFAARGAGVFPAGG